MWGRGRYDRATSVGWKLQSLLSLCDPMKEAKFLWEIMAPLGGPVVPEVYEKVMQSSGSTLKSSEL
jgi:hypothetical protein